MYWFKILLIVLLVLGAIAGLYDVSKGEYMIKNKPLTSAISAITQLLFALGVLFWL